MVFPLLPVMQIILASVYLPANSISEMTGMPFAFSFRISGASFGMPGLLIASSAFRISSSVCPPSSHGMSLSSSICLYLSLMREASETNVSNPFFCARTAAPVPLSPAPNMTILFAMAFYLIFKVIIVIAASTMVTIQKRTVIFDS